MDFIILCIVSKLKKMNRGYIRILLSSMAGALASSMILMLDGDYKLFGIVLSYIVAPALMSLIAFGFESIGTLLSSILYLYAVTIMLGGLLNCIFYNLTIGKYLRQMFGGSGGHSISIAMLSLAVGILLLCLPHLVRYFGIFHKRASHIYTVSLSLNGKRIKARGLFDTGNHLREPISKKPVIIAERSLLDQIMDKTLLEYDTRVKVIPYRSIGKEHGMMYALVIDELDVLIDEDVHKHREVITCIYEGTLSSKKDYQLILHEELL